MLATPAPEIHIDIPAQEPDFTPNERPLRRRILRAVAKLALASTAVGTPIAWQNREWIAAAYEYVQYDPPAPGDIIPDRTGCDVDGGKNDDEGMTDYEPANDATFTTVSDMQSAANSFTKTSTAKFVDSQRILSPMGNYFEQSVHTYEASVGLKFNFFKHNDDAPFSIDESALEHMVHDVFQLSDLYEHPGVRAMVECKRQEIFESRKLDGKKVDVNIVVDGDKSFEGNNVVTLPEEQDVRGHSNGFGSPDISITLLFWDLTPDHIILIAGGNASRAINSRIINRRLVHELVHAMFFRDLSDAVAERDEQERFVKYVEDKLMHHYDERGNLPRAIVI